MTTHENTSNDTKRENSRRFETLQPKEIIGLAIHIERSNARRFRTFADSFRGYDEQVARRFDELAQEEDEHERMLIQKFREHFEGEIPSVKERDIDAVIESVDLDDAEHHIFDSFRPLDVYRVALRAEEMARSFYNRAAAVCPDSPLVGIYRELGAMEDDHVGWLEGKIRAARQYGSVR